MVALCLRNRDDGEEIREPAATGTAVGIPPSEVAEWLASTAGSKQSGASFQQRQPKMGGFVGRFPVTRQDRLLRRLERLGFRKKGGLRKSTAHFRGIWHDSLVEFRIRTGEELEVRTTFHPALSHRRASKFLAELGLDPASGEWL